MCRRKVIPREAVLMKIRADVDARRESTTITGNLWLRLRLSGALFGFHTTTHYVFNEKLEWLCIRLCLKACLLIIPTFLDFLFYLWNLGLSCFANLYAFYYVHATVQLPWYVPKGIYSFHIHFFCCINLIQFSNAFIYSKAGLIVRFQKNSLQHFKKPSAHKHEPVNSLQEAVKVFSMSIYSL